MSTIIDLGTVPGGVLSEGRAINASGQVAGDSAFQTSGPDGFFYDGSQMIDLNPWGGRVAQAFGLNDAGQVVGEGSYLNDEQHAFLWDNGTFTDLSNLAGAEFGFAFGINNFSQVVGFSGPSGATLWDNGTVTNLGPLTGYQVSNALGINDSGQIILYAFDTATGPHHSLLYDGSTMTDLGTLDGSTYSSPTGINNSGQVVGSSANHAFIWDSAQGIQDLGIPPGALDRSAANAINDLGQVVGQSGHLIGHHPGYHATLWDGGQAIDLNDILPDGSGWTLYSANGINNNGMVTGVGMINGADHAFLLNLNDGAGPRRGLNPLTVSTLDATFLGLVDSRAAHSTVTLATATRPSLELPSLFRSEACQPALTTDHVDHAFSGRMAHHSLEIAGDDLGLQGFSTILKLS